MHTDEDRATAEALYEEQLREAANREVAQEMENERLKLEHARWEFERRREVMNKYITQQAERKRVANTRISDELPNTTLYCSDPAVPNWRLDIRPEFRIKALIGTRLGPHTRKAQHRAEVVRWDLEPPKGGIIIIQTSGTSAGWRVAPLALVDMVPLVKNEHHSPYYSRVGTTPPQ
ncbi:hypothetical protein DFH09DRAFT_1074913, partial [Mycena vulgaris]